MIELQESTILESSLDKNGLEWEVVLINKGFNKGKGRYYTSEALNSIVSLANTHGLQCMADHPSVSEARERPEGTVLKVVGWYDNVRLSQDGNSVLGRLHLLSEGSPYPHLPKAMKEAYDRGNPSLYELSIRGQAQDAKTATIEGFRTNVIGPLSRLASTDIVTRGGAGGKFLNILASDRSEIMKFEDMTTEEIVEALKDTHPSVVNALAVEEIETETEVEQKESIEVETTTEAVTPDNSADVLAEAQALVAEARRERFIAEAEGVIASEGTKLPSGVRARISKRVKDGTITNVDTLKEAIVEENEIYGELLKGAPTMGDVAFNGRTETKSSDDIYKGVVGLIAGKDFDGVRRFNSLREAYHVYKASRGEFVSPWSGTSMAEAVIREARAGGDFDPLVLDPHLNEALAAGTFNIQESVTSSTFSIILGTAVYKNFLDDYRNLAAKFSDHRKLISDYKVVNDYKSNNFSRRGVYNSLPSVGQGGTYQSLTTPTEENVTIQVTKYGGFEDLTVEAIANDDLNALQSIPRDMATGAIIGQYRAIFDLFTANSGNGATLDYDSTSLFTSGHANRGTTALSSDSLHTGMETMMENVALSASQATLFTQPRYIVVPLELMRIAKQMYTQEYELEAGAAGINNVNPVKGIAEPIVVPYWTDATNWYLVADPAEMHTIVYATLQGHEEPQILIQDNPTNGSVYTADKISFRVRDVRDQDVLDHRAFFGAIVAG